MRTRALIPLFAVLTAACLFTPQAPARQAGRSQPVVTDWLHAKHRCDLSPAHWSRTERERFIERNHDWLGEKPLARGERQAIAATTGAAAIRAGQEALRQGGTAADAALTTALTQIVLSAGAWNSYAGIFTLVYYEAESGEIYTLDAGYNIPLGEDDPASIPGRPTPSGRTALVPGFMAGVEAAHRRFGKLPFSTIFEPAIYFAEVGVRLDPALASFVYARRDVLLRRPESSRIFGRPEGGVLRTGERLYQTELAATLREVADNGSAYMYTGPWGQAFVKAVRDEGGRISMTDMEQYEVIWSDPLCTEYRGYEVCGPGTGFPGSVHLLEALNVIEFAFPERPAHYSESGEALYWLIQAARLGPLLSYSSASHLEYHVPGFQGRPEDRISKTQAKRLWKKLRVPGWIQAFQGLPLPRNAHSDGIVVMDADGNVAALTHSINTTLWGDTGIFVGGVSIPDSAAFQQQRLEKRWPGARVPHEMNPVIVLRDGRPVLASSSVGGGLHEASLQALHNVLDHGMNPKEAAEAPAFMSWVFGPDEVGRPQIENQGVPAGAFPRDVLDYARSLGQPILELESEEQGRYRGYWVGILREADGVLEAGTSPGLNGAALAD